MSKEWKTTDHKCIKRSGDDYKIRATGKCPVTEEMKVRKATLRGSTIAEAVRVREELRAKIKKVEQRPTVGKRSITHFAARWVARRVESGRWGHSTARKNKVYLLYHILPLIGHLEVDELTRDHIRGWIDYADGAQMTHWPDGRPRPDVEDYSHRTVRSWWRTMRHLVKGLYLEGHIDARIVEWCRDQPGPTGVMPTKREDRTLTRDELHHFVEASRTLTPTRYAEIATLAYTGMRGGELYGLDWGHILYDEQAIIVEQSHSNGVLGPTKTGRARRPPMLPQVAEAIREHREYLVRRENIGLFEGIVFPARNGRRRRTETLHKPMMRIADRLDLDVKVGPQVLRSSFVTILRRSGAHSGQIMAIVGHESEEMHEHYTRPTDSELMETAAMIGG